jgi:nitrite reductase (NADH) small subunit/3-phenylpropionate/trans-cinnamate dioxygenase ferredoxin subunit
MSEQSGQRDDDDDDRGDGFETVAREGAIPVGEGRSFAVNGRLVAVFHLADGYAAISDACPHMGASLAEGNLEGDAVYCPWHAWRFCVRNGQWLDSPKSPIRADSFEVRVVAGEIQVRVPEPPRRS